MIINFSKSDFFNKLFPEVDQADNEAVKNKLIEYYNPKKVLIQIDGEKILVQIQDSEGVTKPTDFFKATDLCTKKRYQEAIPIFLKLIENNPTDSEYYRNIAQAYEESGEFEKAIDYLIDALRWDPSNHWALILMGNIYIRNYRDVNTAMTYFDQVMESNPNNYVALNNIGGIFLQLGKLNVAEKYFTNAYKSNPKFPNVTLGLGLVNFHQGELKTAFDFFIETFRNEENTNSTIYQKALQHAIECSKTLVNQ
jgi:tetratricopeptide (TPR) repeat protein